jgi:predicted metal-dependent peptidase
MQEYVQGKVRALSEKAVHHADARANGWGNIPVELRDEIRRSVSNVINWRNVLRQFVGMLSRGHRSSSIKRINKRYPYIHPGTKRSHAAKLLVAIDESGSVDDSMLEMFFAELEQLTKRVDVTLLHFDCSCDEADVYEWKKGTRPKLQRMRAGGTNFDAPTNLVNDPKNRGRWDGWLCMTDGCAPAPGPSRLKRGWILGQGCKLAFPSKEIQISMNKERVNHGAWR